MSWKHVLGWTTVLGIGGLLVYSYIKAKKDEKAEGEAITLAEAREIVANREKKEINPIKSDEEKYDNNYEGWKTTPIKAVKPEDIVEEEYDDDDEEEEEFDDVNNIGEDEGGRELRHHPDSIEAKKQFIRMELADWEPMEEAYQTLANLFDFPFLPENDGDNDMLSNLEDNRRQFFGDVSRWNREVTFADVILHYAKRINYNCSESVKYWAEYILEYNELSYKLPSYKIDETIKKLNEHMYFNKEMGTHGLFGLTENSIENAILVANRNVDRAVTYDIEYNEFLKTCI